MSKRLIVGIDPGKTSALAILNLNGELEAILTLKNVGTGQWIKLIKSHGKALIIATDVNPPSKKVKKVSASLGAKLYYPRYSLTHKEKEMLTKKFEELVSNKHERAALAASIKAYKTYKNFISRIKQRTENYEEVFEKLLFKEVENLKKALKVFS